MPVKPGRVNADDCGKLGYAQGRCDPSSPSQTAELNPGHKDCGGQLLVKDHLGGDKNPTRRQEGLGH